MEQKVLNLENYAIPEVSTRFKKAKLRIIKGKNSGTKGPYSSVYVDGSDTPLIPSREGVTIQKFDGTNGYIYTKNSEGFYEVVKIFIQKEEKKAGSVKTNVEKQNLISFEQQYDEEPNVCFDGQLMIARKSENGEKIDHMYIDGKLLDANTINAEVKGDTATIYNDLGHISVLKFKDGKIIKLISFEEKKTSYIEISKEIYAVGTEEGYDIKTVDGAKLNQDNKLTGSNVFTQMLNGKLVVINGTEEAFDYRFYVIEEIEKELSMESVRMNSQDVQLHGYKGNLIFLGNSKGEKIISRLEKMDIRSQNEGESQKPDKYALGEIHVTLGEKVDVDEYKNGYVIKEGPDMIFVRRSNPEQKFNLGVAKGKVKEMPNGDLLININQDEKRTFMEDEIEVYYKGIDEKRTYEDGTETIPEKLKRVYLAISSNEGRMDPDIRKAAKELDLINNHYIEVEGADGGCRMLKVPAAEVNARTNAALRVLEITQMLLEGNQDVVAAEIENVVIDSQNTVTNIPEEMEDESEPGA
ncbi:MAG TPA: hypothetical protein DEP72_05060 [Clostridiales bacterium]|nr:MAG: hypothetical protein A2Y18_00520 [Clostridiales bacterium GWD2_32_19]HCC07510.1 hypothetical protein [Clostridiales bacterium]